MDTQNKDNLTDLIQMVQQETKPISNAAQGQNQSGATNQPIVKPGQALTEDGRVVTLGLHNISQK